MEDEYPVETQLISVSNDGAILEMLDGTTWGVTPGSMPACCTWPAMTKIKVEYTNPGSDWPYRLANIGEQTSVRATKLD